MNKVENEHLASPESRGKRVRSIREHLRLSRNDMQIKYGISAASLQNWEDARYGGLSEKGAKRLIIAFKAAGVECTLQWLLYGLGQAPLPGLVYGQELTPIASIAENAASYDIMAIAKELRVFHQLHADAIDTMVADDGMLPYLDLGDYVAGQRYYGQDIAKAIGLNCIVQTASGQTLVRQLQLSEQKASYKLLCTNSAANADQLVIADVQLFSAAPIIWIRKPDLSDK
jgi:transcriptional regulator with XRE-family HTH domain